MTAAALTKALKKPDTTMLSVTAKTASDLHGISGLADLEYLTLTAKIPVLPDEVFDLANLKQLTIKGKTLESLDGISRLQNLKSLYLSGNALWSLPDEMGSLPALDHLDVANNKLTELPQSLAGLDKLQQLYVSKNKLRALPEWLSDLPVLSVLYANKTGLKTLPASICDIKSLKRLSLDDNGGIDVSNLRDLPALRSLSLKNCKLKSLPDHFDTLTAMDWLSLGKNPFGSVPKAIASMKKLQGLYLWECKLTDIPASLGDLPELTLLELERNQIVDLPVELGTLTLRELHVDRNQLKVFPEAVLRMSTLKQLRIHDNQIQTLPDAFNDLVDLEFMRAQGNPFTKMPATMADMKALKSCYLSGKDADPGWVRGQLKALPPNAYVTYNGSELGRDGHWRGDPAPEAPSSRELRRIPCAMHLSEMAFDPQGKRLVIIGYPGLELLDFESGERIYEEVAPNGNCLAIAPGAKRILTGSVEISLRDFDTGAVIWNSARMTRGIANVDVSPDGKTGLAIDGFGHIRLFSMVDGAALKSFDAEQQGTSGRFSPDGKSILTCGKRALRIWTVADGSFRRFVGDKMRARDGRFLPGNRVVSGGFDRDIKVWDTAKKKPKVAFKLDLGDAYVNCMEVTPDRTKLFVADHNNGMWLFDLDSGDQLAKWDGANNHNPRLMAISPDGTQAVTAGNDKVLRVWSLHV